MDKFKVGELVYWLDDDGEVGGEPSPVMFYGSGEESAKLFPEYSGDRVTTDFVVMWGEKSWMPADRVRKFTKLEKVLK